MKNKLADTRTALFQSIYDTARSAAVQAAYTADAKLGDEFLRGFDCGFAWVEIRPATQPFVKWLKSQGIGSRGWNGGWHIWNPSGHPTQSIGPKTEGAKEFSRVLLNHGISCSVGSRLD